MESICEHRVLLCESNMLVKLLLTTQFILCKYELINYLTLSLIYKKEKQRTY